MQLLTFKKVAVCRGHSICMIYRLCHHFCHWKRGYNGFRPPARWVNSWACWSLPARQNVFLVSEAKRTSPSRKARSHPQHWWCQNEKLQYLGKLPGGVIWGPKWVWFWHDPRTWSPWRAVFKLKKKSLQV